MSVYLVGRVMVTDRTRYERYAAAFDPVLRQYGGRLLAADEHPEALEGEWDGRKLVLLAFESREAALTWANSADYREIAQDRVAGADVIVVMAEGYPTA